MSAPDTRHDQLQKPPCVWGGYICCINRGRYVFWQTGGCIGKDYVNKLIIEDDSRHLGFAKLLLAGLDAVLTGRVFISTPVGNCAALTLLETTGWVKAGEIFGLLPADEAEAFFHRDIKSSLGADRSPLARTGRSSPFPASHAA